MIYYLPFFLHQQPCTEVGMVVVTSESGERITKLIFVLLQRSSEVEMCFEQRYFFRSVRRVLCGQKSKKCQDHGTFEQFWNILKLLDSAGLTLTFWLTNTKNENHILKIAKKASKHSKSMLFKSLPSDSVDSDSRR